MVAPTISTVIQQMKGVITKEIGRNIFQRSFHDHIVRDEQDYAQIWAYVDTNPVKWQLDRYYHNH